MSTLLSGEDIDFSESVKIADHLIEQTATFGFGGTDLAGTIQGAYFTGDLINITIAVLD